MLELGVELDVTRPFINSNMELNGACVRDAMNEYMMYVYGNGVKYNILFVIAYVTKW